MFGLPENRFWPLKPHPLEILVYGLLELLSGTRTIEVLDA